jgi:uncharacterized protein (TIGR00255 family)
MLSMTGYAHLIKKYNNRKWEISVSTVNNRFLDVSVYLPVNDSLLDEKVRDFVKEKITRGKVNVKISWEVIDDTNALVKLNQHVLKKCYSECKAFSKKMGIKNDVSMKDLVGLQFAWTFHGKDEANVSDEFLNSFIKEAMNKLFVSRHKEGERLKKKIASYINEIKSNVSILRKIRNEQIKELNQKLKTKLNEVKNTSDAGEKNVIEREINYMILKGDIEEELVRLESHIEEFKKVINLNEPIGKKIGFLVQELTRECNTIGDKLMHVKGKHTALNNKMLLEKIREQSLNIE